jgi:hypothetical protein
MHVYVYSTEYTVSNIRNLFPCSGFFYPEFGHA